MQSMKFDVSRAVLLNAIQSVASAASSKSSLPILSHILIQLTYEQLLLTATNLEIELSCVTECVESGIHVIESGSFTVPAKKFLDVVRAFPEATIQCSVKDGKLLLKCGRSKFTLTLLSANDFPMYPDMHEANTVRVVEKAFKTALKSVIHASANQDVRYYMNGVHLDFSPNHGLNVVATDGHRLALENIALEVTEGWQSTLHLDTSEKLLKILEDSEEELSIQYTSSSIAVTKNGVTLKAKLIDCKFPEYARVIPRSLESKVMIDREAFANSIKRSQCVMNDKGTGLRFEFSDKELMLSGKNVDSEEVEEVIETTSSITEGIIAIGLNGRYVSDALNSMDTSLVKFSLTDANFAVLIENTESKGLRVIMPMRL